MRQEKERRSPWPWVLGGCGGCVVLALVALVGLGYAGFRWTKGMVEELENPEARDAKVRKILGAQTLPEGYHAAMAMSVPWMIDMAILTDKEVRFERKDKDSLEVDLADDDFGDRVFFFFKARSFGDTEDDVEKFFHGRKTGSVNIDSGSVRVRVRGLHREGELEAGGVPVRYRIDRGEIETERGETEGLVIRFHFRCPDSKRLHLALWSGPAAGPLDEPATVEAPEAGSAPTVVAGTPGLPADEDGIRDFLSHFEVCREG